MPSAARPALISSMNEVGPHRYASASRGGSSSASSDAVSRPALSKSRLAVVGRDGCSRRGRARSAARRGGPRLGGERVVAAAACAVQPPDLPVGMLLRERVQHGEHRGGADPGADQQDGGVATVEDEGAARRCDVESVADGEPGVQVAAGRAVGLALDGDPVVAGVGRSGQGVVAEQRPLFVVGLDAQREVLAGARGGKRCAVGVLEADRDHGVALGLDRGDGSRRKPGQAGAGSRPSGRRSAARLSVEQGAERGLPAGAERGIRSARSSCWRGCLGR